MDTFDARADVVVVGGGVMGCSVAYHLRLLDPTLDVLIVERDPTYARASSALSASSIRTQFSSPTNVLLSKHSFAFLREVSTHLAIDEAPLDIGLVERGYLVLSSNEGAGAMRTAHAVQLRCGADVTLLDPDDLAQRFSWLSTDGVTLASYGRSGEGWFDGYGLLQAFRRKARHLGARQVTGDVRALAFDRDAVRVVIDDTRVGCAIVVNAAGPHAAAVARMAGVDLPVRPERHTIFAFACASALDDCPLVVDPSGFYFRPEGARFIAGLPRAAEGGGATLDVDHRLFDDVLWPALADRVPAFEAIRPTGAWAGWYETNAFDHNALIGPWPDQPAFHLINGFSGHGIQQSPAAGRALAELIVDGRSTTVDVSALSPERLITSNAVHERHVI